MGLEIGVASSNKARIWSSSKGGCLIEELRLDIKGFLNNLGADKELVGLHNTGSRVVGRHGCQMYGSCPRCGRESYTRKQWEGEELERENCVKVNNDGLLGP